jgi:TP901 family phage tail tape measure protein
MSDRDLSLGVLFMGRTHESFRRTVNELKGILTGLNKTLNTFQTTATTAARSAERIGAATRKATKGSDQLEQSTRRLNKQMVGLHGAAQRLYHAFSVTASYGIVGRALFGVASALKAGTDEIINFDQALKNIQAITRATDAEIAGIKETIESLAVRTKFSTLELAEGMVYLGQAGFDAAESMQAVEAVATLAAGTLSNLQLTSDLVTTTLRAFRMESVQAGEVADVMAVAINRSKLNIDKLRTAFNYVGAAAHQTGLSLQDTAATMMVLANNGLRASTIGTGFRQVLSRMMAPSRKLREAFAEHNIELNEVNPRLNTFKTSIENLIPVLWDYEKNTVNMGKAYELFGLRGAQAASVIIQSFRSGDWEEMRRNLEEVGAAERMMAIQSEGLAFKFKNLADRAKVLMVAIGDSGLKGALTLLAESLTQVVRALTALVRNPLGAFALQVVAVTGSLLALVKVLKVVGALLGALLAGLAAIKLPFIALAGAVGVLAAGLMALRNSADKARIAMERQSVEARATATSILSFKNILEDAVEKGEDTESILKRLVKAHPELTKVVNDTAFSYDKLYEAMDKVAREKTLEALSAQMGIIEELRQEYLHLLEVFEGYKVRGGKLALEEFLEKKGIKEWEERMDTALKGAAENLRVLNREGELTVERLQLILRALAAAQNIPGDEAQGFVNRIVSEYEAVLEKQQEFDERRAAEIREKVRRLPEAYAEAYERLDALDKIRFLKALNRIDKEKAEFRKLAKEYLAISDPNDPFVRAGEDAITRNALAGFLPDLGEAARTYSQIEEMHLRSIGKLEQAEIEASRRRIAALKKAAAENIVDEQKRADAIKMLDEMLEQERTRIHDKYSKKRVKQAEQAVKSEAEMRAALIKIENERERKAKERLRIERETYDAQFRRGEIDEAEYRRHLDELYQYHLMSYEELNDKKAAMMGTYWESFGRGWRKAMGDVQLFSEVMFEIGEKLPEVFAQNFSDQIWHTIDGVKTLKEAMHDMFKDTLEWLSRLLLKWAALNAMQSLTSGTRFAGLFASQAHSGGTFGSTNFPKREVPAWLYNFAPRLHDGLLRKDEYPAILKRQESVLTPEQMKELQGGVSVTVPVSVGAGGDVEALKRRLVPEIEAVTIRVVRETMR